MLMPWHQAFLQRLFSRAAGKMLAFSEHSAAAKGAAARGVRFFALKVRKIKSGEVKSRHFFKQSPNAARLGTL